MSVWHHAFDVLFGGFAERSRNIELSKPHAASDVAGFVTSCAWEPSDLALAKGVRTAKSTTDGGCFVESCHSGGVPAAASDMEDERAHVNLEHAGRVALSAVFGDEHASDMDDKQAAHANLENAGRIAPSAGIRGEYAAVLGESGGEWLRRPCGHCDSCETSSRKLPLVSFT